MVMFVFCFGLLFGFFSAGAPAHWPLPGKDGGEERAIEGISISLRLPGERARRSECGGTPVALLQNHAWGDPILVGAVGAQPKPWLWQSWAPSPTSAHGAAFLFFFFPAL